MSIRVVLETMSDNAFANGLIKIKNLLLELLDSDYNTLVAGFTFSR